MRAIKRLFINYKIKIETKIRIYKTIIYSTIIPIISIIKMASTASTLFIGYARSTCTTEQVKEVFNSVLDEDIVFKVDELIKTDTNGYKYKHFFIHFSHTNQRLEQMNTSISKDGYVETYFKDYDKKLGKKVDRFWKVFNYTPKPVKIDTVNPVECYVTTKDKDILIAPIVEEVVIEFESDV